MFLMLPQFIGQNTMGGPAPLKFSAGQDQGPGFDSLLQGVLGKNTFTSSNRASGSLQFIMGLTANPMRNNDTNAILNLSPFACNHPQINTLQNSQALLGSIVDKFLKIVQANNSTQDQQELPGLLEASLSNEELHFLQFILQQTGYGLAQADSASALLSEAQPFYQTLSDGQSLKGTAGVDMQAVKQVLSYLETLFAKAAGNETSLQQENVVTIPSERTVMPAAAQGSWSFLSGLHSRLQQMSGSAADENMILAALQQDPSLKETAVQTLWDRLSSLAEKETIDETKSGETAPALSQSEVLQLRALRDLQANIESLLQRRQSLQDLFSMAAIASKPRLKELFVKLLADAGKGKEKQDLFWMLPTPTSLKQDQSPQALMKFMAAFQEWDDLAKQMGSRLTITRIQQQPLLDDLSGAKQINDTARHNSTTLFDTPSFTSGSGPGQAASTANTEELILERINPLRLMDQVAEKMQHGLRKGATSIRIELEPPSLGKLQVELVLKDNQLRALMMAESPQVKHMLESNLGQLRTALEGLHLEVEKFTVFVGNGGNSFASFLRQEGSRSFDQNTTSARKTQPAAAAVLEHSRGFEREPGTGTVDLFV